MSTEETKDKEKKIGCADFRCAPGGFQGMSEIMSKCCADKTDWSAFMKGMKETCCSPETDKTEKETKES